MVIGFVRAALSAFVGALGFGALMHAPMKALTVSSAIGSLGYVIYWLCPQLGMQEAVAMFLAAFVASAAGQIAARKMRMISTIFTTVAILPLVPGIGLYRSMWALGQGETRLGASIAVETMALILMIALGVALGSTLFGIRRRPRRKADSD
ncbi:MAG: threonine/serine exporter family protein [Eubacteriales bacterium]|nr:threonine/serine exporter family protein [Eubacteriales bacterium]